MYSYDDLYILRLKKNTIKNVTYTQMNFHNNLYNMHLENSDFSFHANFKIAGIINRCRNVFSDSRTEQDCEFLEFLLWQLKHAVPGGPRSGGRRSFSVGLPPFLLFVLLPVEGLFCCPSVEQGLITQSNSAPAQISIEIRPLPLPLCPTPAGGSWGMRNAEIRSPHSL